MFICEIRIIVILVCQNLELVGPVLQKIKLPSSNHHGIVNLGYVSIIEFGACLTFLIVMCNHKQKIKNAWRKPK